MAMYGTCNRAAVCNISESAKPPLTSLMIDAPALIAASAVLARIVSILILTPCLASSVITGIVLAISSASLTRSAPGRVDSPPISMMSTPSAIISKPRETAASRSLCLPPSANESGVTFKMPITNINYPLVIKEIASARVAGFVSAPRTAEVVVRACDFLTPRIDIHKCSQSIITMTPSGSKISTMASAI